MRKEEYLHKLEELLYNIPAEDRYEAIQFYSDYLEDAGSDVDEVLRLLGTPEELARTIEQDLYGGNDAGDYTRTYKDVPGEYRFPVAGRYSNGKHTENQKKHGESRKGRLTAKQWIIFVILFCCAAPVIIPIFGSLLGVIIAIVIALAAVVFGAGIAGIVLIVAAIIVLLIGLVKLIISPLSSVIVLGTSLIMAGIGLVGIVFAVWVISKVIPRMFVWIVDILSGILYKK